MSAQKSVPLRLLAAVVFLSAGPGLQHLLCRDKWFQPACSTGDVAEYKACDITWEATLKEGVVSGTIYILQGNGIPPQVQMTFEAR